MNSVHQGLLSVGSAAWDGPMRGMARVTPSALKMYEFVGLEQIPDAKGTHLNLWYVLFQVSRYWDNGLFQKIVLSASFQISILSPGSMLFALISAMSLFRKAS